MAKFKVGDKVRIIKAPFTPFYCGMTGTVLGEDNDEILVRVDTTPDCYLWVRENDIELFSPKPEPVKGVSPDAVNYPAHYTQGKVECIDAIESAVAGLKGMEAMLTGNIIKYLWRWKFKNGVEDLRKARFYLDRLIGLQPDKPDDDELGAGGTTD